MPHKTKFILFGVVLLVAGLTGGHFSYDLIETMGMSLTKKGGFDSYQTWTWVVEITSVCVNLCGILSILYGLMSNGKIKGK